MNRKLIRPNLSELKDKLGLPAKGGGTETLTAAPSPLTAAGEPNPAVNPAVPTAPQGVGSPRRKIAPPEQTNAESFYYLKQMQAKISDSVLTNVSPDARAMIEKSMDASRNAAASVMSKDNARELYISAYARIYTAQELQGAIDFYKSPIGQKWIEKQPQVVTAVMEKTLDGMPQIMDSVKKSMGALDALRKSTNSILSNLLPSATPSPAPGSSPTN